MHYHLHRLSPDTQPCIRKSTLAHALPQEWSRQEKKTRTLRPIFISKDRKTATHAHNAIQKEPLPQPKGGIKYRLGISEHLAIMYTEPRTRRPLPTGKETYMPKKKESRKKKVKVKWDRHLTAFCTVQPVSWWLNPVWLGSCHGTYHAPQCSSSS